MTQTTTTQPSAPASEFPLPPPSRTPTLLRRLQVAAALVLLVLGAAGTLLITSLRNDLVAAPVLTEQSARLGQVEGLLVAAYTDTVRGVLQGKTAATADARLGEAAGLLVEAARSRPADADALVAVSQHVVGYGQALRAATWPETKTAQDSLKRAERLLDDELLPAIDDLQGRLAAEASARYAGELGWVLPVLTVALIAVLAWISWILAHRSHRVLNLGLVGAALAALIAAGVTAAAHQSTVTAIETSSRDSFDSVVSITDATARLRGSERVLTRAALEHRWAKDAEEANAAALKQVAVTVNAEAGMPSLAGYRAAQDKIIALLQKSDWAGATRLALASGDDSLATAANTFTDEAEAVAQERVRTAAQAPADASAALSAELVVVILVAIAGAALAAAGVAQRLREYR